MSTLFQPTGANTTLAMKPGPDTIPATGNITVVDSGSTTTTGANSQTIITGTPTASSFVQFALASLETVQVQVTGTWTGTLQVEVSSDSGTTWYIRKVHQAGTDLVNSTFTGNFGGGANVGGYTHLRVRATAAMTGTATVGVAESYNANIIYVGNASWAVYNASPTTRTEGQGGPLQANSLGALLVDLQTRIAGEDTTNDVLKVEGQFTYNNITGDTTTVVKSGSGLLHLITLNTPIATEVITIYDNTAASGTKIATMTIPASPQTVVFLYDVKFTTGLTILTATAASDITVSYR